MLTKRHAPSSRRLRAHRCGSELERLEMRTMLTRVIDFDLDGDLDVLEGLNWYENVDGYGNFEAHLDDRRGFGDEQPVADIDGDGDLDLSNGPDRWFENVGKSEPFVLHELPEAGQPWDGFRWQDVGGDGDVDIIRWTFDLASGQLTHAMLYENTDGEGTFVLRETLALPEGTQDVGDFDLDGTLDYLLVESNRERDLFAEDPTPRLFLRNGLWLVSGNDNGDAERELLFGEYYDLLSTGRARFNERIGFLYGPVLKAAFVETEQDGVLDIAVESADHTYRQLSWHENLGDTIDPVGDHVKTYDFFRDWSFIDLDGDGDLDSLYELADSFNQFVQWSKNEEGTLVQQGSLGISRHFGDFNGDGLTDFIVGFDDVPIWRDSSTGENHVNGTIPGREPTSPIVHVEQNWVDGKIRFLATADVNGDGVHDVLAHDFDDLLWSEAPADSDSFELGQRIAPLLLQPYEIATGDLDGDGDTDLVVADQFKLVPFMNTDGRGTFVEGDSIALSIGRFSAFYLEDVNQDGLDDIITAERGLREVDGTVRLFLNQVGEFQPIDVATTTQEILFLQFADVDVDQDLDILIAVDRSNTELFVARNLGDSFGEATRLEIEDAGPIAFGDLVGDGNPELVVSNSQGVSVHTYGPEGLTFLTQLSDEEAAAIEIGDIDGDGRSDIVSDISYAVRWFRQTDDGMFDSQTVIQQRHGGALHTMKVADWDGDGDADVFVENAVLDTFFLFESRLVGDVSGDGQFNSSDLVAAFAAGQYEDETKGNSTFAEGDWNGDGDFTTADLVFAFQLGLYQQN